MPPPVFEDWEVPIYQRVSAGLSDTAPPVPVDRELVDGDVLDLGGGAEITQDRARTVASFHRLADLEIETACSAMVSRSRRVPATGSVRWLPH